MNQPPCVLFFTFSAYHCPLRHDKFHSSCQEPEIQVCSALPHLLQYKEQILSDKADLLFCCISTSLFSTIAFANVSEGELSCSVCLNVYQDPVLLRCGHNFCISCIGDVLDAQEGSGYSCPQCRTEFAERPALHRNIALRNIAESLQPNIPEQEISGILCSYCINSSAPAVKTCVHCEASLCEGHVKVHNKAAEHILIEPTTCLENRKCPIHKKILEYYCNKESVCICVSCRLDGKHKQHQVESINTAFEKKRQKLKNNLERLSSQKAQAKSHIQMLLDHENKMKKDTACVRKTITTLFIEIKEKLDALERRILHKISLEETLVSKSVSDLIQYLETEMDTLSKKMMKVEKLCNMTDTLHVLQEHGEDNDTITEKHHEIKGTTTGVKHFHQEETFITLLHGLSCIISDVKTDMFPQTDADIILDRDTAGNNVNISEDLKTASYAEKLNNYPEISSRFSRNQVLSKTIFSLGQHYWEVETGTIGDWRLGVAYSSIDRKDQKMIGGNNKSWCLRCFENKLSVVHNNEEISVAAPSCRPIIGVYLDYEAGRLTFYALCDPIRHIHTFTTAFTEPLHAAFLVSRSFATIKGF
ncbi:E3 ubiquitin/ISG15 ligase TRIM25-like [Hyperolius riggenbachi]|uniref:E3 ubiquitin/ISG15 ligase TRIM25-like n=1 Tax=Hyperolius riggenbachi TaxID=752182 RepID=UPI0035A3CDC8